MICPRPTTRRASRGFTLTEAALTLTAVGVVAAAMFSANRSSTERNSVNEGSFSDQVMTQLFEFARRNHRLPCPDSNGDGFEDLSGTVCSTTARTGGVPYYTLGMQLPAPVGTGRDTSLAYSVYRGNGDVARDLTQAAERSLPTPHEIGHASYMNSDDLKQAVINALNATSTVDAAEPHVTGNGGTSGVTDCVGNRVANMAFVLVQAGSVNADRSGSDFDSVNLSGLGWTSAVKWSAVSAQTCFAGPGKADSSTYDDKVKAVSFLEFLGVLNR